jgi:hypothetical protein
VASHWQCPLTQRPGNARELHTAHGPPPVPQAALAVPDWQSPLPSQQPGQRAVQLTGWPQLLVTEPHRPAQVLASLAQPQTPGVPPPPQTCPCRVQF